MTDPKLDGYVCTLPTLSSERRQLEALQQSFPDPPMISAHVLRNLVVNIRDAGLWQANLSNAHAPQKTKLSSNRHWIELCALLGVDPEQPQKKAKR